MDKICPFKDKVCGPDCPLWANDDCLMAEFCRSQIASVREAMKMMQQFMPVLRRIYDLPEETKEQLPDELRKQIEDIFKNKEEREDS